MLVAGLSDDPVEDVVRAIAAAGGRADSFIGDPTEHRADAAGARRLPGFP